ncbi:MAG: response regulator transcription factor [Acidobacteria bacterium]|nr:response regulator transcription factor [Acidobacteriota bacterium]
MEKEKILVVDNEATTCVYLKELFSDEGYYVETADTADEAVTACSLQSFDTILLDLIPGIRDLDLLPRLHTANDEVPIIIMTAFGTIKSAIAAIKKGAFYYVTKPFETPEELLYYVKKAIEHRRSRASGTDEVLRKLSKREIEILKLVSEGHSNKEIAMILFISPKTVETHCNNIMKKVNLHDRTKLARLAIMKGLVKLPAV